MGLAIAEWHWVDRDRFGPAMLLSRAMSREGGIPDELARLLELLEPCTTNHRPSIETSVGEPLTILLC